MCESWDNESMQDTQKRLAREFELLKNMGIIKIAKPTKDATHG